MENQLLRDLNVPIRPGAGNVKRIEVICNGLPLWGGAQLAVDTTLVSALGRDGQPRDGPGDDAGKALRQATE